MSQDNTDQSTPEFDDPESAAFYTMERAGHPVTIEMMMDRPETDGHSKEAILAGLEKWEPETVEYGDLTAYYLGRESTFTATINREMYEELRAKGHYIGEDSHGTPVHLREDYRSVGKLKDDPPNNTWGPLFPVNDESDIDRSETATDHQSRRVMLEAVPNDIVQITSVHEGMHRIPEKFEVVKRTNTYHGPSIQLLPEDTDEWGRRTYELTCPDRFSQLILWRAVTDTEGFIYNWSKIAKISAEIFNVAKYDICEGCGEPIKDPMHRSLAMIGQCNGQLDTPGDDPQ